LKTQIKTIRDKWEPYIDKLIHDISEQFGDCFSKLGCVGEVRISKDIDYDKWGLEILVKFRDNESLAAVIFCF
jgi:hypothetical protein